MLMNLSAHLWKDSPPPSVAIRNLSNAADKLFTLCVSFDQQHDVTLFTRGPEALDRIRALGQSIVDACEKIEPAAETVTDTGWVDDSPTGQFMARTS